MRVLVILGHPRTDSFCAALAKAFAASLARHGIECRELILARLNFDPHVRHASIHDQPLEHDLVQARATLQWADHFVFVYPVWWGTMPALLKGFLDRILLPGFAFREKESGPGYEGLLQGKSAQLLTTMDTPPWLVRWVLRRPGHRAFEVATLRFCGIAPVRSRMFGPVKNSSADQRQRWLNAASREAGLLRTGSFRGPEVLRRRAAAWLRALRLPFYPMSWLAYTAGAALAVPLPALWKEPAYWWGYVVLFLIEVITVFLNELHDFESDRRNVHHSSFNGGSRVLVENRLTPRDLRTGSLIAGTAALGATILLQASSPAPAWANLTCLLVAAFLGIGYTVPPLKFSHRGAGEIVVAFTHSLLVIQAGSLVLGGPVATWPVWQLGLPLFLAVLPSITLSGLPDREADDAAGKHTLAVRWGPRGAIAIALTATAASAFLAVAWHDRWPALATAAMLAHSLLLVVVTARQWTHPASRRLDGLMVLSLSYLMWFVVIPLCSGI